jgi:hypothetical protein
MMNTGWTDLQMLSGITFSGACWGVFYWATRPYPKIYSASLQEMVLIGTLLGFIFGFLNIIVLFSLPGKDKASSQASIPIYTGIMLVIYSIWFLFFSPHIISYIFNVFMAVFISWYITRRALRTGRKEKEKNA